MQTHGVDLRQTASKKLVYWDESEKQFLLENYSRFTIEDLAKRLNKSFAAIDRQIHRLGIRNVVSVKCRFCGEQFLGNKQDLMRQTCLKVKCFSKRRKNKYVVNYGQVLCFAKYNNITTKQSGDLLSDYFMNKRFCAICGRTEDQILDMGSIGRRGFQLDHIDGDRQNYTLINLQILCWKCNTCKLDMPIDERSRCIIKDLTDIYYKQKEPHE